MSNPPALKPGEKFRFEVSGLEACAAFDAVLETAYGDIARFRVVGTVQLRSPYENARIRRDRAAAANAGGETFKVCVKDVSLGGMGLISEKPAEKWKPLILSFDRKDDVLQVEGQVRYCRTVAEDEDEEWPYRIGLSVANMAESLKLFQIRVPANKAA